MSKAKPRKGGNLNKPELKSKAPALPDDKAKEKPMLPSIFTQGEDEKTVVCTIESDQELKALQESFGTKNRHLWNLFFEQLGGCANGSKGAADNLNQLVPILYDIAPRDTLETMLAVQMVGIHNVSMRCLRQGMRDGISWEAMEKNINQGVRLLQTFTAQMEALQKYRGKGTQQKVTVEHVHVHQGGQAIVGAVNHQEGGGDDGQS